MSRYLLVIGQRTRALGALALSAVVMAGCQGKPAPPVQMGARITTIAGDGGPAAALSVGQSPTGVAVSGNRLYVADPNNAVVRAVDLATGMEVVAAGSGLEGDAGDEGLATTARLRSPVAVAADEAGDLFIVDQNANRVRKVSPEGIITTVAGTGSEGVSADGGPAAAAPLNVPTAVAVDGSGNVYLTVGGRIRRVDRAGIITTLGGGDSRTGGLVDPRGLAIDRGGSLWVADAGAHRIWRASPNGGLTLVAGTGRPGFSGDGAAATAAQLNAPTDIAVDAAGNVLVADHGNHRVRKISPEGLITTVAGTGNRGYGGDGGPAIVATLDSPGGLTVDRSGSLFVADTGNRRVRLVSPAGVISSVAGNGSIGTSGDGGPASRATLVDPAALSVARNGSVFIADAGDHRIRMIDRNGRITTVAGLGHAGFAGDGGKATSALLNRPLGIAVDDALALYISDSNNRRVRKVDANGVITTVAGTGFRGPSGDGGPATQARLTLPAGLAISSRGLLIADAEGNQVWLVDHQGIITTIAGSGRRGFSGDGGPATAADLELPTTVAVDSAGNILVADTGNGRIRRIDLKGIISTVAGGSQATGQLAFPSGVVVDDRGSLYVSETLAHRIRQMDTKGHITTVAGSDQSGQAGDFAGDGGLATLARLNQPAGLAIDGAGNLLIADTGNHRIRRVELSGRAGRS